MGDTMTAPRTPPLRVACLGAGYFSQFHLGSWQRIHDVAVVGVADVDQTRARATGHPAFADLDTLLGQTAPHLLDIILPPQGQAAAIERAIDHGVRTVICQKPFCTSLDEARRMTTLAENAGVRLIIHENFRFQPWYRAMKSAMNAGQIGTPLQMTFRFRPGDGQGPDAYLDRQPGFQTMTSFLVRETAVHWLDTFRYLLGEPQSIYADLRRLNPAIAGEDAGYVLLAFPQGVRAMFDGNRLLDHPADNHRCTMGEALMEGTTGTLSLSGDGSVWHRAFVELEARCILAPTTWDGFGGDCVHAFQSHVVDGVLRATPLENEARTYLRIVELEQAAYASAETGCRVEL